MKRLTMKMRTGCRNPVMKVSTTADSDGNFNEDKIIEALKFLGVEIEVVRVLPVPYTGVPREGYDLGMAKYTQDEMDDALAKLRAELKPKRKPRKRAVK